jgi:hypothetical protein
MTISAAEYFSQHADQAEPDELTPEIEANARDLLDRVNRLLIALGEDGGLRSG